MKIQLSDHFTFRRLLLFTLPSILMMVFTSIYSVVDGFFVSNFVGKTPFAAVNFIMPFLMILGSLGAMFGTGGSALISKALGEGKPEKAKQLFSFLHLFFFLNQVNKIPCHTARCMFRCCYNQFVHQTRNCNCLPLFHLEIAICCYFFC